MYVRIQTSVVFMFMEEHMKIAEKIRNLKAQINAKAESMAKEQEVSEREKGIAENQEFFEKEFNKSKKGEVSVYGGRYVQIKENDEIKGYEVYKNGHNGPDTKAHTKDGKDLFSLRELAEYHYDRSNESEDYIFDSMIKSQMHKEKVEKNKKAARRDVIGAAVKKRLNNMLGK